jgi:hypothetical protein
LTPRLIGRNNEKGMVNERVDLISQRFDKFL